MADAFQVKEITVSVQPKRGGGKGEWMVKKKAMKAFESDNEVTVACLESLGYPIPDSRVQELTWGYKSETWVSQFVVVDSGPGDLALSYEACDLIRRVDHSGAFPILKTEKSSKSKDEDATQAAQQKARQEAEKAAQQKEKLKAMRPASDARRDSGTG